MRREALALCCNIALFNPDVQQDHIHPRERYKPLQFTLILFEKVDSICNLNVEFRKVRLARNRVEP